jgi:hypothetical protein
MSKLSTGVAEEDSDRLVTKRCQAERAASIIRSYSRPPELSFKRLVLNRGRAEECVICIHPVALG